MKKASLIAGGVGLMALATALAAQLAGSVQVDGSSTVYPITSKVAEVYNKEQPSVRVTVGVSGTGGGFKRFTVGETDISDASRPIKEKEAEAARSNGVEFIELPVAYDGLSIVVNKANNWVDQLTVDDLKKIFIDSPSMAKTWKDVNPKWPAETIKIYAPGTDSGTFDYFKEVVAGEGQSIRSDMSVSEDDNVLVRGVEGERPAIGFFGYAYFEENKAKLRAIPIVNRKTSKAVAPSSSTVESGEYAPFSRPLFIYVNKKSAYKPEVKSFVDFYLAHPEIVDEVGYVKLPQSIRDTVMKHWRAKQTGTSFLNANGEKVEGALSEVYK